MSRKPMIAAVTATAIGLAAFVAVPFQKPDRNLPATVAQVRSDDPHDWPEWRRFRSAEAKHKPARCEWSGCRHVPTEFHHGISAKWCVKAGRPDLVYTRRPGQWFLWLCRDHHELAHNICKGCGGEWSEFNLDSAADAKAGRWNSRGRSEWTFQTDAEALAWIKGRLSAFDDP